jgi:hypothetical protein
MSSESVAINGVARPLPPSHLRLYLSPALARSFGGPPAFETKYVLDPARAERVEEWARRYLQFDPHADPANGGVYRVHTLYFDTPGRDMFRRAPGHARHKFRVRRYGAEPVLFLERKTRVGDRVVKRRTRIEDTDLIRLAGGLADPTWSGHWFHRRLSVRGLRPACRVSYDRVAHIDAGANGPLRLTLDRRVHCALADDFAIAELPIAKPALNGEVIVELKYRTAMPALFKDLLVELGLAPRPTSKYRLGVAACNGSSAAGSGRRGEEAS